MRGSVVMAPLSNDPLRDWPAEHFRTLAVLCIERLGATVSFLGTRAQRGAVNPIVRTLPSARARNLCGLTDWAAAERLIDQADCVVANNSGIAHVAAGRGVPTVCVFGASHSPAEWMPRGPSVTVLVKRTACAPCGINRIADCPSDRRCLREIPPVSVFDAVVRACAGEAADEGSPLAA